MEHGQTQNSLGHSNSLSTEDSPQSKRFTVMYHLLASLDNSNCLSVNLASLHNDFETTQRVRNNNVYGTDCSGCNQTSYKVRKMCLGTDLLLDPFLKLGLTDKSQHSRSKRMTHEWNSSTEKRNKVFSSSFSNNFHDRFGRTSLFKVRTLLLLNHTNRVDEGSRKDGSTGCSDHTDLTVLANEEGNSKEDSKFGHTLESNSN
mmetsp:Transcript_10319/g.15464  ORF Transcript_10319/g.15464 Transcript_10319/m.15464 type:complete len:202 (-) Transcript_10319:415-1020(-)